jgi:hypothetical protein
MRAVLASFVIAVSLLAASQPAMADRRDRDDGRGLRLDTPFLGPGRDARDDDSGRGGLSANEAARRAQAQNGGGRVLSVEPSGNGYRVKLLRDGEVRVVHVQ